MIDDLLDLSRMALIDLAPRRVDLSALAADIVDTLRRSEPGRSVEVVIDPVLTAWADPVQLRVVLENLLGNAWKYTARTPGSRILQRHGGSVDAFSPAGRAPPSASPYPNGRRRRTASRPLSNDRVGKPSGRGFAVVQRLTFAKPMSVDA